MSGIEQAAAAFDADLNGGGSRETASGPTESVFGNSFNGVEVDENSPEVGGGDLTLPEGVDARLVEEDGQRRDARRPKPQREREEGQDDNKPFDPLSDDILYADDPAEEKGPDDDEEDEDEDPDAEDGDPADLDSKVTVTIDGKEEEVSVREALNGYIRTETFHRRLAELDQGKQEVQAEAHKVVASRKEAADALSMAEEILATILPEITQEEWDAAFAKDPAKARAMQRSYDEIKAKIDTVKQKRAQVDNGTNQQQVEQTNKWINSEARKFNDANPQWGNGEEGAKKRQKDLSSMARTAKSAGFSDEEVLGVYDSRMLNILLKASRFDRIMASRPKPGNGIKTARPGAGRTSTAPKGLGRAAQNHQRVGSVETAGQVFTELLRTPTTRRR